jgi:23S rRNA (uridine2552-2'-O)-methyltransferase
LPSNRLLEKRRDFFYRLAKKEGYRSRASYKLLQANKDLHFIKNGDTVIDLGAAPGGWMQATREIVGDTGLVIGVDLSPIRGFSEQNVKSLRGDIKDPQFVSGLKDISGGRADVVLSDVSPNLSGIWEVDHARQLDLAQTSLKIARGFLESGGSFFCKVFQGDLLDDFLRELRTSFRVVKIVKPKASKSQSSEIYVLGSFPKFAGKSI